MSKKQTPVMKCFISFNTERSEELCESRAASNWETGKVEETRILFTADGEKKTARLEDPGGPQSWQRD
jgi:hypothetical protein